MTEQTKEKPSVEEASDHHSEKPHYDDLDTAQITLVGFVGSLIVFLIILVVQIGYYMYEQGVLAGYATQPTVVKGATNLAQQKERLQSEGQVDGKPGVYYIPIDKAMQIVVAEQGKNNPDASKPE